MTIEVDKNYFDMLEKSYAYLRQQQEFNPGSNDIEKVVRCKDCVAYKDSRFEMNVCTRNNQIFPRDGYCNFGIMKSDIKTGVELEYKVNKSHVDESGINIIDSFDITGFSIVDDTCSNE